MLFIILITLCVVLFIIKFSVSNRNYWRKKNIIQVDDLMYKFFFGNHSMPEVCKTVYDEHDAPHIGTTAGSTPMLMLKNLEDVQAVFAGDFHSFYSRGILPNMNPNDVLSNNLLFMDDFNTWKLLRQKLSPVFTSSKLKNMFFIIEKCARDFVELVENNQSMRDKPFNALYTYTTGSIGASVFGIDTKTNNSTMDSPFLDMAWRSVEPSLATNIKSFVSSVFPKLSELLNFKVFGEFEDFFVGVVKSVMEERRRNPNIKRHDFIEICVELQNNGVLQDPTTGFQLEPTDELIAAQAFFFFIAGADTTANTMHFTLLELASNPKILKTLHEEIDSVFEPGKTELTYADIEKLQYMEMVMNEAMRKYPPIGFIQRVCTKDTVLPSKVIIEKGTGIIIPAYAIHRDERFYSNPDEFDPERFGPNNIADVKKYSFMPFGEGNRICIGARLARLQVKTGLAWLLRRFTLGEQKYAPERFERSPFGLRDPHARYDLIPRNI
ncbi:putative cytochrome P450 6a13 [Anticarsia gemmatalis]|uniref:putative cytochrome P450 6a13 n=1 Tax=Anticarsia gemmatalis TaxID=129554 RepID=UPI003F76C20F